MSAPSNCETRVQVAIAPGDHSTARWLRGLERAGVVVVDAVPSVKSRISTADLADAVLRGLGKSKQLNVLKRTAEPVALAWLCGLGAADVEDPVLVVLEAQTLDAAGADTLRSWAGVAGIGVCFVLSGDVRDLCDHELLGDLRDVHGAEVLDWAQLRCELERRPIDPHCDPLMDPEPSGPRWRVPRAEGALFHVACRDALDPATFAEVSALYCAQVQRFLEEFRRCGHNPETRRLEVLIRTAIEDSPSTEELVVTIRAAQVAALRYGFHLAVDTVRLVAAAEVLCRRGLAEAQGWWRRLAAYVDPDPGAVAALYAHGIDLAAAAQLAIGDLADTEGGVVACAGGHRVAIEGPAAQFLVAQRHYRLLCGASGEDPLFSTFRGQGITERTVAGQLRLAAAELGIDLIEEKRPKIEPPAKTYLARYGLRLSKLLKAPNTARSPEEPVRPRAKRTRAS